jgi:hypothetical protein
MPIRNWAISSLLPMISLHSANGILTPKTLRAPQHCCRSRDRTRSRVANPDSPGQFRQTEPLSALNLSPPVGPTRAYRQSVPAHTATTRQHSPQWHLVKLAPNQVAQRTTRPPQTKIGRPKPADFSRMNQHDSNSQNSPSKPRLSNRKTGNSSAPRLSNRQTVKLSNSLTAPKPSESPLPDRPHPSSGCKSQKPKPPQQHRAHPTRDRVRLRQTRLQTCAPPALADR